MNIKNGLNGFILVPRNQWIEHYVSGQHHGPGLIMIPSGTTYYYHNGRAYGFRAARGLTGRSILYTRSVIYK